MRTSRLCLVGVSSRRVSKSQAFNENYKQRFVCVRTMNLYCDLKSETFDEVFCVSAVEVGPDINEEVINRERENFEIITFETFHFPLFSPLTDYAAPTKTWAQPS